MRGWARWRPGCRWGWSCCCAASGDGPAHCWYRRPGSKARPRRFSSAPSCTSDLAIRSCGSASYDRAWTILRNGIRQARDWGAPALLPYGLLSASDLHFRVGRWAAADAAVAEAVELAEQTGQPNDQGYALCVLARIVGERPAADPEVLQWEPDLIEAYVRAGRRMDAEVALREFADAARRSGDAGHLPRPAGATACSPTATGSRSTSARRWQATPPPFETARTRLCFGERLRRAGRRVEARENLQAALRTFDRLGAQPWSERARGELGTAVGSSDQRRTVTEYLTSQELRVALAIADGSTNRQTAAALFLSTKTIEFHLRNIYRKLGIGSRTELVRAILTADHTDRRGTP